MWVSEKLDRKGLKVKLLKSPSEMLQMLKAVYGESTMSTSIVFRWHKCFREGTEDENDEECQGAPVTKWTNKNVTKIWELVISDCSYNLQDNS
jgi:hypothetical protein